MTHHNDASLLCHLVFCQETNVALVLESIILQEADEVDIIEGEDLRALVLV